MAEQLNRDVDKSRNQYISHLMVVSLLVALAIIIWTIRAVNVDNSDSIVYFGADYPSYASLDELSQAADTIAAVEFLGKPTTVPLEPIAPENPTDPIENPEFGAPRSDRLNTNNTTPPIYASVWRAEVVSGVEGGLKKGDRITVRELGGNIDGVEYLREGDGASPIARGEALVFLQEIGPHEYVLLNPDEAMMVKGSEGFLPDEEHGVNADAADVMRFINDAS